MEQLGKQIETLELQLAATNNGRTYPRSRPNDAVSRKRSDGVVCWYCGKRGHIKRNCAKLKTSVETAAVGSCLSVDGRLGKLVVKILIDTGSASLWFVKTCGKRCNNLQRQSKHRFTLLLQPMERSWSWWGKVK